MDSLDLSFSNRINSTTRSVNLSNVSSKRFEKRNFNVLSKKISVYVKKCDKGYLFHLGNLDKITNNIEVKVGETPINVFKKDNNRNYTPLFLLRENGTVETTDRYYFSITHKNEPATKEEQRLGEHLAKSVKAFQKAHPKFASSVEDCTFFAQKYSSGKGKIKAHLYGHKISGKEAVKAELNNLLTLMAIKYYNKPSRAALYQLCSLFIGEEKAKYGDQQSEESIASFKKSAEEFYTRHWVPPSDVNRRLFNAMLQICEDSWRSRDSSLEKQLTSLTKILNPDPKLVELALETIKRKKPNPVEIELPTMHQHEIKQSSPDKLERSIWRILSSFWSLLISGLNKKQKRP